MTRPRTDATLSSGASRSRRLRRLGRLGGGLAIGALVLSILSLDTAQGQVHPIDGLKAGEWYEVPNSKLRNAEKKPNEYPDWNGSSSRQYDSLQLTTGFPAIVKNWNGAAFDTVRNRLIIFGGGHMGYGGNELFAFNLNTLRWERLTDPVPFPNYNTPYASTNPATPIARHSYNGNVFIAHADRFFSVGGSPSTAGGCGLPQLWVWDAVNSWRERAPNGTMGNVTCNSLAAYDPVSKLVFIQSGSGGGGWMEYSYDSNTIIQNKNSNNLDKAATGVVDWKRRKLFVFGGGRQMRFDIAATGTGINRTFSANTITTSGPQDVVGAAYPGLAYDPITDRIVAYIGGTAVFVLHPDTLVWTKAAPAATNAVVPPSPEPTDKGLFGRWRWSPKYNAFVMVRDVDQNVFVYKLSGLASTSSADTTAPTVSLIAPSAGASLAGTILLTATASDNAGIAGVQFKLATTNVGAEVTRSPYSLSWDTTAVANGTYTLVAVARDTSGNTTISAPVSVTITNTSSGSSAPSVSGSTDSARSTELTGSTDSSGSTALSADADLEQRCTGPGVVRCFKFDSQADVAAHITSGTTTPMVDTAVKASGGGSLKMTVPSNSGANVSGTFSMNFTPGSPNFTGTSYPVQFGEGEEFYVQWRQRFSPEFLSNRYLPSETGWKQVIIGEGDRPGVPAYSCTQLEIVPANLYQRGVVQIYHSCGGKDGRYEGLEEPYGSFDFKMQNAMPEPYCLYSKLKTGDKTGCFQYKANQWMTFQMHVKIGTWYKNDKNYRRDSWIELWVAEEGQPSKLVISRRNYDIANNNPAAKYGKVWLLPYMTAKNSSQVHPTAYTWYDELIVSRQRIADPGVSASSPSPTSPTSPTPSSPTLSSSVAIAAPSAGTTLQPGQPVTVTGTGTNLAWEIDRIGDGLASFATGSGSSFTFTVPANSTAAHLIRVTLRGSEGTAQRDYTIATTSSSPFPSTLAITAPSAGTALQPGQSVTVTGAGTSLVWDIDRIGDGLASFATGSGSSFIFTVPANSTAAHLIRVTLRGTEGTAQRDYAIASPTSPSASPSPSQSTTAGPYPASDVISAINLDWSTHRRLASGSDNWPVTWAADDHQYTAWGDGGGFGGSNTTGRVSLGVGRIEGPATSYTGINILGGVNATTVSTINGKSYGILALDGALYMWVSPGSGTGSYLEQRLYVSTNGGLTWARQPWAFSRADGLVNPTFLQYGKAYAGARDGFVYVYANHIKHDSSLEVQKPGEIALLRVPRTSITDRSRYEFFAGFDSSGRPTWTPNITARRPVFTDVNGVGWNTSVSYNPGLRRYLLMTEHDTTFASNLGMFEAPEPWGPWSTVLYEQGWGSGRVERSAFFWNFSNKWLSADGKQFVLIFTGIGSNDSWNSVRGTFLTTTTAPSTQPSPAGPWPLSVTKLGTGAGTVTSEPTGINCGGTCSASYADGLTVQLKAAATSGSVFTGWSAACPSGIVTMTAATTCTATFAREVAASRSITVSKVGTGNGTITSSPSGVNCGSQCTASFAHGTAVQLNVSPTTGSLFAGWSGDADCTDSNIAADADKLCVATFSLAPSGATPSPSPSAAGRVIEISPSNADASCNEEFEAAAANLQPGDQLVLRGGVYTQTCRRLLTELHGTAADPIVIRAAVGEKPVLTRPANTNFDFDQNNLEIHNSSYLVIRGLTFIGGDVGVRFLGSNHNITFEDNEIADTGNVGVSLNSGNSDAMILRRNHIHHTGRYALGTTQGEGIYLGCHDASCRATNSLIEGNYIHHLRGTDSGGNDGIEIKAGSAGNMIRDNVIHDTTIGTRYPCIFSYGGGAAINIIEGNVMWNCGEAVQVASDTLIRNNLILFSDRGITATPHAQVPTVRNVTIVNNTIYGHNECLRVNWSGATATTLANNAIYCPGKTALNLTGLATSVVRSNYVEGQVTGATLDGARFVVGGSAAAAFRNASAFDLWPASASPLRNTAEASLVPEDDFNGHTRVGPFDVGAYETEGQTSNTGWKITAGFKVVTPDAAASPASTPSPAPAQRFTLTTKTSGPGRGILLSTPGGINCGSDCTESFTSGTAVTLTPVAQPYAVFKGWSGDADCADGKIVMNANKSCTARFVRGR